MGVDLLTAAEALYATRPDLASAVLVQVMDAAEAAADRDVWLAAAGLAVAAGGGSGDGRTAAMKVLSGIDRWGPAALTAPSAHRLRVELALLAAGAGEPEMVRVLVGPVLEARPDHRLHAQARIALARSAGDPAESTAALRAARERCPDDADGRALRAETVLVGAAIARHDGTPRAAAEAAEEGLRLIPDGTVAAHDDLRMSLVAESIAALLDAGDVRRARAQAAVGAELLARSQAPRRQRALLQLTVASAFAATREMAVTVADLVAAAQEAADSDTPDLEAICRSALGAIHEKAGRLDSALDEIRAGVDAQHRDRDREVRFVAAVDALLDRETPPADAEVQSAAAAEVQSAAAAEDDGMSWLAGSPWGASLDRRSAAAQSGAGDGDPARIDRTAIDRAAADPGDDFPVNGGRSNDAAAAGQPEELPSGTGAAEPGRAVQGRSNGASSAWSGGAWSNGARRNGEERSGSDGAPADGATGGAPRSAGHRTNGHGPASAAAGRAGARHARPDTGDRPENGSPAEPAGGAAIGRRRAESEPARTTGNARSEHPLSAAAPARDGHVDRPGRTSEPSGSVAAGQGADRAGEPDGRAVPASAEPPIEEAEVSWPGLRWWAAGRSTSHPAGRGSDGGDGTGPRGAAAERTEPDAADGARASGRRRSVPEETEPGGLHGVDGPGRRSAAAGRSEPDTADGARVREWRPTGADGAESRDRADRPGRSSATAGRFASDAADRGRGSDGRRVGAGGVESDARADRAGRGGAAPGRFEPGAIDGDRATGGRRAAADGVESSDRADRTGRPGAAAGRFESDAADRGRGSDGRRAGADGVESDARADRPDGGRASGRRRAAEGAEPNDLQPVDRAGRRRAAASGRRPVGADGDEPHELQLVDGPGRRGAVAGRIGPDVANGDRASGRRRAAPEGVEQEAADGARASGRRPAAQRPAGSDDLDRTGPGRDSAGVAAGAGGRRRRAPEPVSVDHEPDTAAVDDDPLSPGWTGLRDRELAAEQAPAPAVDSDDVQAWMGTALDELDRVWGPLTRRGTTNPPATAPVAEPRLRPVPSGPVSSTQSSTPAAPNAALGIWAGSAMPAPAAPVTKDALADLARRLTVAPERIQVAPPGPSGDAPDHDTPDHDAPDRDAPDQDMTDHDPGAVGCAIVVDLARDNRRFAGLRAATVIREVAELVAEHVPAGSRLRFDEPHVLALVQPGWAGPEATRWMYRTLPRLLAGFTASEDIPGVQLRATVHDVDGPVGAQLLHRVDASRAGAGGRHGALPGRSGYQPSEPEPRPARRTRGDDGRPLEQSGWAGGAAPTTRTDRAEHRNPGAERPTGRPTERQTGRPVERPTERPEQPKAADPAPFTAADADGLGLADLLAGALAAYRSI